MVRRDPDTILLVEDDDATRELYRKALVAASYTVRGVADGLDALQIIESNPPAVVVLDLMLPRVGGVDVYRELRANPQTRELPVIVVTGADSRESEPTRFQYFLRKPVSPDALVTMVDTALRRSGSAST